MYGNRSLALNTPNSIVLTRSKAEKYFPNEDPVGKLVALGNDKKIPFTVGGSLRIIPATHIFNLISQSRFRIKSFGRVSKPPGALLTITPTYR